MDLRGIVRGVVWLSAMGLLVVGMVTAHAASRASTHTSDNQHHLFRHRA